ncbi:MAG TPA: neutral/alkaline non-lysosomal ceramidase N-terminal domain-containing protein [Verrucomicrobiales bacterium]|nr:neutral/alkaline non-lysosomal ceramidase N-terminal domain-containing protein [Verrucomicrobiales bacterium]
MRIHLFGALILLCSCSDSFAADWKAAAAKAVITPAEPMVLSGFASREVPAEGTAMDLYAKSLVIEDAIGTRFVMVTLDLVEVPFQLRDAVAAAAKEKFSLPAEALQLNCSHTHCGPELRYTELEFMSFTDPKRKEHCLRYNAWLTEKVISIIGEALQHLEPATISYGHARCGFAMNRRLKSDLPTGDPYLNSPNPEGVVDHDVPVLTVTNAENHLKAVVFGYACHNTSMNIKQWHGDYAGHAQQMIEETHPGTIALFMMGCGGDQNAYPRFSPIFSARHGQSLATAVEAAIDAKPKPVKGPLKIGWQTTRITYQSIPTAAEIEKRLTTGEGYEPAYEKYLRQWDEKRLYAIKNGGLREYYDYPIQIVRFGNDLTLVALSGETCVDYSLRLKREFEGPGALWVAGYSNDVLAYIPSKRVLLEGGYEALRAMMYWSNPLHPSAFADTIEEIIIGKVHEMLKQ